MRKCVFAAASAKSRMTRILIRSRGINVPDRQVYVNRAVILPLGLKELRFLRVLHMVFIFIGYVNLLLRQYNKKQSHYDVNVTINCLKYIYGAEHSTVCLFRKHN